MKIAALSHYLDGNCFMQVHSGHNLVNKDNPGLLAWTFPHLDPFGIWGFSNPNFMYVCWNM